jgi:uncharacterized protein YndB with AHSA1/START domain
MASIVGKATVTIDRPANEVWDWVVDPANMHLWVQDVDEPGNWIDDGGPTTGSRYRIDYEYGRGTNEITFEVKAATPEKTFVTDTVKGPYPILVEYGFEESADGESTDLSIKMNARSESVFQFFVFILTGWFAKRFMKRRLENELAVMKSEIEKI